MGFGMGADHWAFHAWLQWLPFSPEHGPQIEAALSPDEPGSPAPTAFGLQLGPLDALQEMDWDALRGMASVFDPFAERVQALQEMGVRAHLLSPSGVTNGWLHSTEQMLQDASERLGLPPPHALVRIAEGEKDVLVCLGSAGEEWEAALTGPCLALPAFDDLLIQDWQHARLLACWLNTCCRAGLQLVRVHPTLQEFHCTPYRALQRPQDEATPTSSWMTPPMVWGSILPRELMEEEIGRAHV